VIALLDVNVLVALFDPVHIHHDHAHEWFAENRASGWATCPITENGMVRVLSNPSYPGRWTTVKDAIERLELFRRSGGHTFWPDSVSLRDKALIRPVHLQGYRQVADVYLLALAVSNAGRLATFDKGIPLSAVTGANAESSAIVGGASLETG
jgi:hypothetical protein